MKPKYYSLAELLNKIDEPNRSGCFALLEKNRTRMEKSPGSSHNHQIWPGGYLDHVQDAMNCAVIFFDAMSTVRPLPFSLSDALLVIFLHDLEKPWKYVQDTNNAEPKLTLDTKESRHQFRIVKAGEYNIQLNETHLNAIKYIEGEHADYSPRRRTMGPLAAFCHLCDITSARIWFDYPKDTDDPWIGAA